MTFTAPPATPRGLCTSIGKVGVKGGHRGDGTQQRGAWLWPGYIDVVQCFFFYTGTWVQVGSYPFL